MRDEIGIQRRVDVTLAEHARVHPLLHESGVKVPWSQRHQPDRLAVHGTSGRLPLRPRGHRLTPAQLIECRIAEVAYMSVRFVMLGGFLGAGKTTTLSRLAKLYQSQGRRVGVVTNDQAHDLVDTKTFR